MPAWLRFGLLAPLSVISSCGGASPELVRSSPIAAPSLVRPAQVGSHRTGSSRSAAPDGRDASARATRLAPAPPAHAPHVDPLDEPTAHAPQASDAWAEQQQDEADLARGYEQRFPLYGVAFHVLSQVYAEPNDQAQVIGYLRRGAPLRASRPVRGTGCERAWHELSTGGYVCEGRGFSFGTSPQRFEGAAPPPSSSDALPYRYAKNTGRTTAQYWRIPTPEQAASVERLLGAAPPGVVHAAAASDPEALAALALPEFARAPIEPGFYVSLSAGGSAEDERFARTVRGAYVESAALREVVAPQAPGVVLRGNDDLPLAIAYRSGAKLYRRDAKTLELRVTAELPRFASISLTQERVQRGGQTFLLAKNGDFVEASRVRVVGLAPRPAVVPRRARFIHVDLEQQTLVAYEGGQAVFATLVSSGKPGFETPQGVFRIYAKHVSATMDGLVPGRKESPNAQLTAAQNEKRVAAPAATTPAPESPSADEAYSIEDVPWTMYFQGSYALHAAFWHDRFGNVRSHGCVNLAPADARWLFHFSTPSLPGGWHGVVASNENPGTFVAID